MAVGRVTSCTVTVALPVAGMPLVSVTVRVTVLSPTLAQVKLLGSTDMVSMATSSKLPPSTSAAVMVALPAASSWTVWSLVTTVGGVGSKTVAVALQLLVLPLLSVTVRVTVLSPMSALVKLLGDALSEAMPEASLLPLSMSAPVSVALPAPSSGRLMSWQTAAGGMLSSMVTVETAVFTLPLLSVTVSVTLLAPISAIVKEVLSIERPLMPHASLLALSTSFAVMVALPSISS